MPRIDVRCSAPDPHESEVYRPLAMYPATPPCPICGEPTEQFHPAPRTTWTVDPVIVYQGPDGKVRFPGDAAGAVAANYERQGYTRIELRGAAQVRHFEAHMNKVESSRLQRKFERRQAQREARETALRSELRMRMQSMTRSGRDFARLTMAANDRKPTERPGEAGFHSDVYANDRSNRAESRDDRGRRRRD